MKCSASVSVEHVGGMWIVRVAGPVPQVFHCASELLARRMVRVLERGGRGAA